MTATGSINPGQLWAYPMEGQPAFSDLLLPWKLTTSSAVLVSLPPFGGRQKNVRLSALLFSGPANGARLSRHTFAQLSLLFHQLCYNFSAICKNYVSHKHLLMLQSEVCFSTFQRHSMKKTRLKSSFCIWFCVYFLWIRDSILNI